MHTVDSTSAPPTLIPQLQAAVTGRVIGPDDADYDAARTVMPGDIDRHPAVIVKVADAQDVDPGRRHRPRHRHWSSPSAAAATARRATA